MPTLLEKLATVTLAAPSKQPLLDAIVGKATQGWYEGRTEELARELRALGDAKLPDEPFAVFVEACDHAVYNADQRDQGLAHQATQALAADAIAQDVLAARAAGKS